MYIIIKIIFYVENETEFFLVTLPGASYGYNCDQPKLIIKMSHFIAYISLTSTDIKVQILGAFIDGSVLLIDEKMPGVSL